MGTDVHVQRTSKAVTASNAKNIQELTEEVRDLRETVGRHDETIKEIETAREEFEESLEQDLDGETLAETEAAAEQSAGAEFAKGGGKGLLKRLAAGGAGVATMIGLGASDPTALADVLPVVASSVVGAATDGADAALSQGGGATPEVVAETVETKLAQSEDFAEKIATNDALAEALAGKEAFVDRVADLVAGKTGGKSEGLT